MENKTKNIDEKLLEDTNKIRSIFKRFCGIRKLKLNNCSYGLSIRPIFKNNFLNPVIHLYEDNVEDTINNLIRILSGSIGFAVENRGKENWIDGYALYIEATIRKNIKDAKLEHIIDRQVLVGSIIVKNLIKGSVRILDNLPRCETSLENFKIELEKQDIFKDYNIKFITSKPVVID